MWPPPLVLAPVVALGCARARVSDTGHEPTCGVPPVMELSSAELDFGDIELGSPARGSFEIRNAAEAPPGQGAAALGIDRTEGITFDAGTASRGDVSWTASEVDCGEASAKLVGDSVEGPELGPHTGLHPRENDGVARIPAGCVLPVDVYFESWEPGDAWVAVRVQSTGDDGERGTNMPRYDEDPVNGVQELYLHGRVPSPGRLSLIPSWIDFGEPAPGVEVREVAVLQNRGVDDLTFDHVSFDPACSAAFSLVSAPVPGTILAQFETTSVEVSFVASVAARRACVVWVSTDDPEAPRAGLYLGAYGPADSGSSNDDDDGDGFTETGGDCDDTDPSRFPRAPDLCNDADDNCDGLKIEEGCVEFSSSPRVTGGLAVAPDACQAGDEAALSVLVAHRDGRELVSVNTGGDEEVAATPLDGGTRLSWSQACPEPDEGNMVEVLQPYLVVTSASGQQDWATSRLTSWAGPSPWVEYACDDDDPSPQDP